MYDGNACLAPTCEAQAIGEYGLFLCEEHAIKTYVRVARLAQDRGWKLSPSRETSTTKRRAQVSRIEKHAEQHGYQQAGQVVYVIRFGTRVKIGTTVDLPRRLRQLPHEELLAVIPGDESTERALHRQFARHRLTGDWFQDCPELREWCAEQRRRAVAS